MILNLILNKYVDRIWVIFNEEISQARSDTFGILCVFFATGTRGMPHVLLGKKVARRLLTFPEN